MVLADADTMYTVVAFLLLTITSATVAYRDGARSESCYGHEVDHRTFGVAAIPTVCADPCTYTLDVVGIDGIDSNESITTYKCNRTYTLNLNYSVNAFEGFLVQARNVSGAFDDDSSIHGIFLDDSSYLYKSLSCGVSSANETVVFPNSATQKVPVNEEEFVPLYWRAPDPMDESNQLPDNLTFWFTIVQQQQTFFFPIEGPTLARDNESCIEPTTEQPATTTEETTTESVTTAVTDESTTVTATVTVESTTAAAAVTDESTTAAVTDEPTTVSITTTTGNGGGGDEDAEVRTAIGIGVGIALPLFILLIVLIVVAVYLGIKYFPPSKLFKHSYV